VRLRFWLHSGRRTRALRACLLACLPACLPCLLVCLPACLRACVRAWVDPAVQYWDGHLTRAARGSIKRRTACWLAGYLEDCDMRRTPTPPCNYRPVPLGLLARAAEEQDADLA
jgi:hypothetical protein